MLMQIGEGEPRASVRLHTVCACTQCALAHSVRCDLRLAGTATWRTSDAAGSSPPGYSVAQYRTSPSTLVGRYSARTWLLRYQGCAVLRGAVLALALRIRYVSTASVTCAAPSSTENRSPGTDCTRTRGFA
eukprot:1152332-Rhodomonas_salina.1